MKPTITCSILTVLALAALAAAADVPGWNAIVIRDGGGSSPAISDVVEGGIPAKQFVIDQSGMKAGWGTDALNGLTIGDITRLAIDRLDDNTRFAAGSGPAVAPYFNIWVTDGSGNYAVIANEPSNPAFQPLYNGGYDLGWADLADKTAKAYENADVSWINTLDTDNNGLTFAEVAGLQIQAPSVTELQAGWAGLGTGAPDELGTYAAYGFTWVFGDTLSNYVSGDPGYVVANPVATPEPMTLGLLGLGGLTLLGRRRR